MNTPQASDHEFEQRVASRLLDVLIRAGLILALVMLCTGYTFLTLMVWALILAVTLCPLNGCLRTNSGAKPGGDLDCHRGPGADRCANAVLTSSMGDGASTGHRCRATR
jgi:hypothetical protein